MMIGYKNTAESIDSLYFALLQAAVADMRTVYTASQGGDVLDRPLLETQFSVHERGQHVGSAVYLQQNQDLIDIPRTALRVADKLLEIESSHGFLDELLAAAVAGTPWEFPRRCMCGLRRGTWRQVYFVPGSLYPEIAWRYNRPENHVPLCYRCAARFGWRTEAIRIQLAKAFWGYRFEAFTRWQAGCLRGTLENRWDKSRYPLWPARFGDSWASGSGALEDVEPRMPDNSCRGTEHQDLLQDLFPFKARCKPSPRALQISTTPVSL